MSVTDAQIRRLAEDASDREHLWTTFVEAAGVASMVEIGVFSGAFAERLLADCASLRTYYMVDPWRHLDDWNKPANLRDDRFEAMYQQVMQRTERFADKRVVLRGTTTEVIDQIADDSLDFAYIDGDHTLKGITIDLTRVFPKVREGGWIGGDDFVRSIFQHKGDFEPTLVFPYAVYFAEAVGARIYALPYKQFLLQKVSGGRHEFVDLAGRYGHVTLRQQLLNPRARRALQEARQAKAAKAAAKNASRRK